MYQVTLENINGTCWTVSPPCYGFMKRGVADRSHYTFSAGLCGNQGGFNMYPNSAVPFNQLKYIWNSGTHVNHAGYSENPEFDRNRSLSVDNQRYLPNPVAEGNLQWRGDGSGVVDYIKRAAAKLTLSDEVFSVDRDYIDEILDIERYFDAECNSIVTRHPMSRTMFGVKVDDNVPADRALNYLMIARLFTTSEGRTQAYMYGRYVKGLTPAQAIIFACILSVSTNWQGHASFSWIACSNDSCIYPAYMLACGVGALYAEPTQVLWRQTCYNEMGRGNNGIGHQRESESPKLRVKEQRTGNVKESVGAMFMAIFSHRSLAMNWKTIPIAIMDIYNPEGAASMRRHNPNDVAQNNYSQNSSQVYSYWDDVRAGITSAGRQVDDVVIELLNTPLAQPAA